MTTATDTNLAPRLRLGVMRLARRLRQQAGHDVTPSMLSALSTIERLGPLTLGRLAELERVRPPTISKVVTRLEDDDLVVRTVDEVDQRVAHVTLSPRGKALVRSARSRKDAFLADRLRALSTDERAALERAVGVIEGMLEDDR
ncbi:MAG TPA: MarR family transcriptional regulator [Actinomycetota bacterium]|jgi:DNA-binding MarR family transcriptional regulator